MHLHAATAFTRRQFLHSGLALASASVALPSFLQRSAFGLPMPALVMHGARTRLYYRLIAETVAASAPHDRAVDIDGAGHMSIVERPDAVAAVIAEFVAAVEAGR